MTGVDRGLGWTVDWGGPWTGMDRGLGWTVDWDGPWTGLKVTKVQSGPWTGLKVKGTKWSKKIKKWSWEGGIG